MIKVICTFCKKELNERGAILFSPPDNDNNVIKYDVCRECFKKIRVEK